MVSEAVQTNGINNGNNAYSPYLVTSSNNVQFKHTQQNVVAISQPHSVPSQRSLPSSIKEPLPCVTSRSQMSSQTLANAYNLSEPNYMPQSTTTHHEMHQPYASIISSIHPQKHISTLAPASSGAGSEITPHTGWGLCWNIGVREDFCWRAETGWSPGCAVMTAPGPGIVRAAHTLIVASRRLWAMENSNCRITELLMVL